MRTENDKKLDFSDVLIRPKRSYLTSRKQVSMERKFTFMHSKKEWTGVPIMAANMDGVGTMDMADTMGRLNMFTCLIKTYSIKELVGFFVDNPERAEYTAYSMGIMEADAAKFRAVYQGADIKYLCIDVANGYSERFLDFVNQMRTDYPKLVIIAGNVVTADQTQELLLRGADVVKVGIGPGSVCTTRIQTGVGYPQLSATIECADAAHGLGGHIIADGGCACPGDVAKAFGAGADFVMLGGMFAGHDEGGMVKERILERSRPLTTPISSTPMTGNHYITAQGGNIGDFQIIDGQISGSNITLNADNSTIFKTDQGPGTDSGESNLALKDEYYIDFSPTGENPDNAYVKFGPNFTVDKDGILIASGATFIGTITASAGLIGGFTTDSHSFHSSNIFISGSPKTGGLPLDEYMFISTSKFNVKENGDVTGSSVLFSGGKIGGFEIDSTQINSSNDKLILKSTGEITGSQVLFSGGKIGGFNIESDKLINEEETVELSSITHGLNVKDNLGVERVSIKSGSFQTIGGGQQYIGNKSFEDQTIAAGRNVRSGSNITSWSFSTTDAVFVSLTDRSGYSGDDQAVSGDNTLDIVVPTGAVNYTGSNQYLLENIMTESFAAGDTISFSSVARYSSSFNKIGKDRALGPQYFRGEYSASGANGWIPFLPENEYTASNGYGEYFLGSGQYNSFGASAELPEAAVYIKLVLIFVPLFFDLN